MGAAFLPRLSRQECRSHTIHLPILPYLVVTEFDLIKRYFAAPSLRRDDVVLGIGDDAALVTVPYGSSLAVSVDTLVENVHFPGATVARDVGYKALAVNLSDMAAMGAEPAWATLALTLPDADERWLAAFSEGFFELAGEFGVRLIGGDTCRGALAVTVQMMGHVPAELALRRDGAGVGDSIFVTGTLGDAGLGLQWIQGGTDVAFGEGERAFAAQRLNRPTPRVAAGCALRACASAAIDVSDGLAADLGHILHASGVGATLNAASLPLSSAVKRVVAATGSWFLPLAAGDDYELCFTAPSGSRDEVVSRVSHSGCAVTCIGQIDQQPGLRLRTVNDEVVEIGALEGYRHFG